MHSQALTAILTQRDDVQSQALTVIQLSQWPPISNNPFDDEFELCEACKFNVYIANCREEYRTDCTCGEDNYMDAY